MISMKESMGAIYFLDIAWNESISHWGVRLCIRYNSRYHQIHFTVRS